MMERSGLMQKIKYDLITRNILIGLAVVSGSMIALSFLLVYLFDSLEAAVFWVFSLYIGGGIFLYSIINLIAANCYFCRLKGYGYIVPKRKTEYQKLLSNLPKEQEITEKSIYGKYNRYAAVVAIAMLGVFSVMDLAYYIKWFFMGDNALFLFVMTMIFYCVAWLWLGVLMFVQSNPEKYRDDVELDATRKERWGLNLVIVNFVILFLICFFAYSTEKTMTKYIFETMVGNDVEQLRSVKDAVQQAVGEYEEGELLEIPAYKELCEGVDIVTWDAGDDALKQDIANRLNIVSFSELSNDFRMADYAGVYVKLSDGDCSLQLLNVYKEVRYSKRSVDGKIGVNLEVDN